MHKFTDVPWAERVTGWGRTHGPVLLQVAVLTALWWLAMRVCGWLGVPQLGGVVGMFVLWLLLANGWLPLTRVQQGARWLVRHMLLFFIPAVLVLLDHRELLGWVALKLVLVIVLGTVMVMACTALSIEWCLRMHRRREAVRRVRQRRRMPHAEHSAQKG